MYKDKPKKYVPDICLKFSALSLIKLKECRLYPEISWDAIQYPTFIKKRKI